MFMYEKAFKARLKTLYPDLTYACNDALSLIRLINGGIDDKTAVIQEREILDMSVSIPYQIMKYYDVPQLHLVFNW